MSLLLVGRGHACPGTCVDVSGQLHGVGSHLPPLMGYGDQTQVIRLVQQVIALSQRQF